MENNNVIKKSEGIDLALIRHFQWTQIQNKTAELVIHSFSQLNYSNSLKARTIFLKMVSSSCLSTSSWNS